MEILRENERKEADRGREYKIEIKMGEVSKKVHFWAKFYFQLISNVSYDQHKLS